MAVTGRIGMVALLTLLSGCVYAYQAVRPDRHYSADARPDPAYYCYDCHGYRYFDPYYDWCPNYGFVYHWEQSPALIRTYRERFVALKVRDRRLGRWRYPNGYRVSRRYREPRDYQTWLEARPARPPGADRPDPEQRRPERGSKPRDRGPGGDSPDRDRGDHRPRRIDS